MAALVCDICGGKLIMGAGGIAVCDSCGMEHSQDRMKEKVQEIRGVVQVDNSHMIENYMRLANNAYNSDNKREAEDYCNKVIEIVPNHKDAWLLKGRAAGWQSTLGNIRIAEAINCFANAIEYAGEDKSEVIEACKEEVGDLSNALIRLRAERFIKWPDEEERNGFLSDLTIVFQAILQFFNVAGSLIDKDKLMAPVANIIFDSVMNAWNRVIRPQFENDHDGHPDDYELNRLLKRAEYCTDLLTRTVELAEGDFENDIKCYRSLIRIHEYMIGAKSYSYETVHTGYDSWDASKIYENKYVESKSLTEASKSDRRKMIARCESKIKEIEAQKNAKEKKERDDYWEEHQDEGSKLKAERKALEARRAEIQKQYKTLTDEKEKEKLEDEADKIWKDLDKIDIKLNGKRGAASVSRDAMKSQIFGLKRDIPKLEEQLKEMSKFHPHPGWICGGLASLGVAVLILIPSFMEPSVLLFGLILGGGLGVFGVACLKQVFPESISKRDEVASDIELKKDKLEKLKFELL